MGSAHDWGGTPEKRRRFLLAVYAEIRRRVGDEFPVAIKLNSADFQHGGFDEDESLKTMQELAKVGIDLIEISGGTYEAPAMSGVMRKASTIAREAYFLEFAENARAALDVPLMVTGGFRSACAMNAALQSESLDVVGIARLMAIDPEAPTSLLRGQDSPRTVRPIKTGISLVDRNAMMEVLWYELQLGRIADDGNPRPDEAILWSLLKIVLKNGWGTFKMRRARSSNATASSAPTTSATRLVAATSSNKEQ